MGELGALFNPGMRHELEERQSKAARREEEGNARDGDLRIDLESGVAVINVTAADDAEVAAPDAEQTDGSQPTVATAGEATSAEATSAEATSAEATSEQVTGVAKSVVATEAVTPTPQALRPRGKRGMSASTR